MKFLWWMTIGAAISLIICNLIYGFTYRPIMEENDCYKNQLRQLQSELFELDQTTHTPECVILSCPDPCTECSRTIQQVVESNKIKDNRR